MRWLAACAIPTLAAIPFALLFHPRVWYSTHPFFLIDLIGLNKFAFWVGNWAAFWLAITGVGVLALAVKFGAAARYPAVFGALAFVAAAILGVQLITGMPASYNIRTWKSGELGVASFMRGSAAERHAKAALDANLKPFEGTWTFGTVRWQIDRQAIQRIDGNDRSIWMRRSMVDGYTTARFAGNKLEVEDSLAHARLTVDGNRLTAEHRGTVEVFEKAR